MRSIRYGVFTGFGTTVRTMRSVAIGVVLTVAAAGLWFATREHDSSSAERALSVDQANASHDDPTQAVETKSATRSESSRATSVTTAPSDFETLDPKSYRGGREQELQLVAQSPEEAYWLESRGYPKPSVWQARADVPSSMLEAKAAAGDTLAMVMLGERLFADAQPGERYWSSPGRERAVELLEKAFEDGNVFAQVVMAQNMAKFLRQSTKLRPDGKPEWGRRYDGVLLNIETLALLGDYRAGDVLMSLDIPRAPGFSSAGISSGVIVAFQQLALVNERRAQRGLPPLSPAPRPGAATALAANIDGKPFMQWRGWR